MHFCMFFKYVFLLFDIFFQFIYIFVLFLSYLYYDRTIYIVPLSIICIIMYKFILYEYSVKSKTKKQWIKRHCIWHLAVLCIIYISHFILNNDLLYIKCNIFNIFNILFILACFILIFLIIYTKLFKYIEN